MVVIDLVFTKSPTKADLSALEQTEEVDQAHLHILDHTTMVFNQFDLSIELIAQSMKLLIHGDEVDGVTAVVIILDLNGVEFVERPFQSHHVTHQARDGRDAALRLL